MGGRDDGNSGHHSDAYSANRVRQGRIVLNTPARRGIFIAGLIGGVVLAVIAAIGFRWF